LKEEVVNPTGDFKGVEQKMAQIEGFVHVERNLMLMELILSRENLITAFKRVVQNKGSHGVDGMSVKDLRRHLYENWDSIRQSLREGIYKPLPVRRVEIPKPNGGVRLLGIPTVTDRFIQQAIAQVLTKIFDQTFSDYSYGFRPGRKGHDEVREAKGYIKEGYRWVVRLREIL
jgi:RNA-directed DNA polymerase